MCTPYFQPRERIDLRELGCLICVEPFVGVVDFVQIRREVDRDDTQAGFVKPT